MEKFELEPQIEKREPTPEYHFREIAEIEPAMTSLVMQMKEKIDNGEYDTLISDDVGGRIPALILRRIIKERHPEQRLETYFIASGKLYFPTPENRDKYLKLQEHLERITAETKKALVITQFIFTGKTVIRLAEALKRAGVENFDIAALDAMPHFEQETVLREALGNNSLFVGSEAWHHIHEEHETLGGVRKTRKEYSPFPRRIDNVVAEEGRQPSDAEYREIFGIEDTDSPRVIMQKTQDPENVAKFERWLHTPLSSEEREEINRNINFAREDAKLLADRVMAQIWTEKGK